MTAEPCSASLMGVTEEEDHMRRVLVMTAAGAILLAACGGGSTDTTTQGASTTSSTQAAITTSSTATTTSPATTTVPETTTTAAAAALVPVTPVVGLLDPYSPGGADLFPPGSVEAHWYQWDGLYVVLYRGFDAASGAPICAGNSIFVEGVGYGSVTNSPHNGLADEICVGAAKIAEPPSGVYACDTLLYYLTEIPSDVDGMLWGTLEIGDGEWQGQTSQAKTDLANTPMFEPGLAGYELPPTTDNPGGKVSC